MPTGDGKGRRILVVDDEADIVNLLVEILTREGHQADTAPNGAAALTLVEGREYDLILCDLRMPVLDGPGFYRELQQRRPELVRRLARSSRGPSRRGRRSRRSPNRRPMMDEARKEKTRKTAQMLFHTLKGGTGFETWKKFDKDLARELSMFFTGTLYSREVISQKQRELCAVASLTVLNREHEVHAHIHAALNVGATRQEVAEVIFQQVTYGGMPVVVEALRVFKEVLEERGEWE